MTRLCPGPALGFDVRDVEERVAVRFDGADAGFRVVATCCRVRLFLDLGPREAAKPDAAAQRLWTSVYVAHPDQVDAAIDVLEARRDARVETRAAA